MKKLEKYKIRKRDGEREMQKDIKFEREMEKERKIVREMQKERELKERNLEREMDKGRKREGSNKLQQWTLVNF